uniref:Uncharacterized protein n=1 Tax=mine drainage metagenome TaxID=410659 RepID=E6PTX7_9ZZZZ
MEQSLDGVHEGQKLGRSGRPTLLEGDRNAVLSGRQ